MTEGQPPVAPGPDGLGGDCLGELLDATLGSAPHELPDLVRDHARSLGALSACVYLVGLQAQDLNRFGPGEGEDPDSLPVDATLAGMCFRRSQVYDAHRDDGLEDVWVPLLDGADRLGVLHLVVPPAVLGAGGEAWLRLARRFGTLVAALVVTKSAYGDAVVATRRRHEPSLAAEVQWGILPPLTFVSDRVNVAGALEPAYEVAGDSLDYAVGPGRTQLAAFDAVGHGLASARISVMAVFAYRHARRCGLDLEATARRIDEVVRDTCGPEAFSTAVLAELDTDQGRLRWVNAGHPEPLLVRQGRFVGTLAVSPWRPLGLGDDGLLPPSELVVGEVALEPGDRVLFYTDGVVEARSADGELFGVERLADLVTRDQDELPVAATMRRAVGAILGHQHGKLDDDASLLLVEWPAPPAPPAPGGPA
ncbi:MAG: PP2C family protein-serine/threonine phosphatase [Actinomycetota bacterium]|nr:PP2C family protein-serine/threonine phosphatase [Actinomycetota bacterium]